MAKLARDVMTEIPAHVIPGGPMRMVLSMTVCVALIAAVAAQNGRLAAQGKGQTLDEQASVYRLTMPNVKAATSAAEALAKAVAGSPTLRDKVEFDTDEPLDPQLAKFQAIPEAAAALKAAGISARDYVLTATAIIGASLLQLAVDANGLLWESHRVHDALNCAA